MKRLSSTKISAGFTFMDLLIVLVTAALLVGWFLPWLARPRCGKGASRINCINNLKQIGLAFRMWSNDHGNKFPMSVSILTNGTMEFNETGQVFRHFRAVSNELYTPKVLVCSSDTKRTRATNWVRFSNKNVSYFVGLDADETQPQMILSGDRNVTGGVLTNGNIMLFTTNSQAGWSKELHKHQGNVGLADGSAQQVTASGLRQQFQSITQSITNAIIRLAIP